MEKLLLLQLVRLVGLCLLLTINASLLATLSLFGLDESRPVEAPQPVLANFCGVIDYGLDEYSDGAPLDSTQLVGRKLFEHHCSTCHNANAEALVGPGLLGITKRRDLKWIVKWVQNPDKLLQKGDPYAIKIYERFNKTSMTAFENLSVNEITAIVAYVEGESNPDSDLLRAVD